MEYEVITFSDVYRRFNRLNFSKQRDTSIREKKNFKLRTCVIVSCGESGKVMLVSK